MTLNPSLLFDEDLEGDTLPDGKDDDYENANRLENYPQKSELDATETSIPLGESYIEAPPQSRSRGY